MIILGSRSQYSCILCFNKRNWLYSCKNSSVPLYILLFLTKMPGNFWLSPHIPFICKISPHPSRLEARGTFLMFSLHICLISISAISMWIFPLRDKSIFQRVEMNWAQELRHTDTLFQKSDAKKSWFREHFMFKTENPSCWVILVLSRDFREMTSNG